jgi:thiol:disulfide interchange protein DsbC
MMMNKGRTRATRPLHTRLAAPVFAAVLAATVTLTAVAQPAGTPPDAMANSGAVTSNGVTAPATTMSPTGQVSLASTGAMAERLQALYPSTRFGAVNPTPWPGVFEVVMGTNLAYVDASGQYFLFGHFYDMKKQRDLTAERKDSLARVDFTQLPLLDAMKEVRGDGSRVLAIFSDPDCPYCQRLESDLRGLTNVAIYTFLMPLVSLHPGAHRKAVSIWCARDRLATWQAAMWRGEPVPPIECPHPVDRNVALGERLGINGTPTLISADGRMLPGAASKDQIEAWLQRSATSATSAVGATRVQVAP